MNGLLVVEYSGDAAEVRPRPSVWGRAARLPGSAR
jgi:hypothetical protein